MKKHIYSDKTVSYFYEIGDKVKLTKNGEFGIFSTYKKGEIGEVYDMETYKDGRTKLSTLTSFIWIKAKQKYKGWSRIRVPVWELKPFNNRIKMEKI